MSEQTPDNLTAPAYAMPMSVVRRMAEQAPEHMPAIVAAHKGRIAALEDCLRELRNAFRDDKGGPVDGCDCATCAAIRNSLSLVPEGGR